MTEHIRRLQIVSLIVLGAMGLASCTTSRQTDPPRSATEELIISSAVDRMTEKLQVNVPKGTKVFVDNQYFDGTDAKYAMGAIRDRLLRAGAYLVADRKDADMVVETRSGAQSIDETGFLIGVPKTPIPVPLAGTLTLPEIALFKRDTRRGIAKAAITGYDAKTGELKMSSGAEFGYSRDTDWTVLLLISWSNDDIIPDDKRPEKEPYFSKPSLP